MMLDDKQGRGRAGAVLDFYLFYSPFFLDLFHAFFMLHVWWFCSLRLYLCFGWNFSSGFFFATPSPLPYSSLSSFTVIFPEITSIILCSTKQVNQSLCHPITTTRSPLRSMFFFSVNSGVHAVGMLFRLARPLARIEKR